MGHCARMWAKAPRKASIEFCRHALAFEIGPIRTQERLAHVCASEFAVKEAHESGCLDVAHDQPVRDPGFAHRELVQELRFRGDRSSGLIRFIEGHDHLLVLDALDDVRALHEPFVGSDGHEVFPLIHQVDFRHARHETDDFHVVLSQVLEVVLHAFDAAVDFT